MSNGGLPKALNKADFFKGISKPENQALLNIFTNLDLIDQTGHGVPLIINKYGKEAFYISNNTIIVTIPINKELLEQVDDKDDYLELNETETEIYNCIKENENITIPELSNEANVGERQVMRVLNKLKEKKYIKREGSNKKGFWKVL